jgi:hypothetical protein
VLAEEIGKFSEPARATKSRNECGKKRSSMELRRILILLKLGPRGLCLVRTSRVTFSLDCHAIGHIDFLLIL